MGKQTKKEIREQEEEAGLALTDSSGLGNLTCMFQSVSRQRQFLIFSLCVCVDFDRSEEFWS
ncbi:hypothetical protein STEG23_006275, partial [Scotinomys teguina]